jgi:thiol:disulfide interchange protein/DsbC/DsbD-like thiol-disulfide interchange protein
MNVLLRALFGLFALITTAVGQLDFGAIGEKGDQVTPSLIANTTAVVPGKPFTILVQLKLKEGWHVYWQYGGDSGLAPSVNWQLPEGFTAGPIQWPLPTKHFDSDADQTTYIYEHEALLPVEITPPPQIATNEVTLKANVSWLVCEKICIPGQGEASIKLPVAAQAAEANAELFATARSRLPKSDPPPFRATWNVKPDAVTIITSGLPKDATVEFFPLPSSGTRPGHATVEEPNDKGERTIRFPVKSEGTPNTAWRGLIVARIGDGPRSGWTLSSPDSGKQLSSAQASSATSGASGAAVLTPADPFKERSLAGWLWAAFLGGLILNLMPCVLPVISLKIFSFVSQAGQEPRRVFRLGLAFVAGVFVFFLALAVLAIALHSAGKQFFWGMQFADPRLFIGLIALVVVFALAMFGVFEITLGGAAENALGTASQGEGYGRAFVHGLFTTLLGTSCTAPLVGPVLGFATTQPPPTVLATFLLMAAGMSLPYFLLTWHPEWMRYLPRPGAWMERFKQLMGFVLLGVAVWLLGAFGKARGVEPMTAATWFLVILAVGIWIYGAAHRRWWAFFLAVAITFTGAKSFLPDALRKTKGAEAAAAPNSVGIVWETFSPERLAAAQREGRPVFIDFTAEWCPNCKANEKLVLNTRTVAEAFKAKNVLTLKADFTDLDPAIGKWITKFNRVGVPVYVLYRPGETQPVIFSEILTQKIVLDELNKIGPAT